MCQTKGKDWAFYYTFFFIDIFWATFHTSWRSVRPKAGNGPENSGELSGHSFCFFGTECLEVPGQLGRLAGRVAEGGESRRREGKEGSAL